MQARNEPSESLISKYLGLNPGSQVLSKKTQTGARTIGQKPMNAKVLGVAQNAMKEIQHASTQKEVMLRLASRLKDPEKFKAAQSTGNKELDKKNAKINREVEFYFNKLKNKADLTPAVRNQLADELVHHAQQNLQGAIDEYRQAKGVDEEAKAPTRQSKKTGLLHKLFGKKDEESKKAITKEDAKPTPAADATKSQIAILQKQVSTQDKFLHDAQAALSLQTPEPPDKDVYMDFARFVNSVGEGKVEVLVDGKPMFGTNLHANTYETATIKASIMLQQMMNSVGYQSPEALGVMTIFQELVNSRKEGGDAINATGAVLQQLYYCLKDSSGALTLQERLITPPGKNLENYEGKLRDTLKADQERYERLKSAMQKLPDKGAGLFHLINFVVNQRPLTSASSVPAKALESHAAESRQAVAKKAFEFPSEGLKRVANFSSDGKCTMSFTSTTKPNPELGLGDFTLKGNLVASFTPGPSGPKVEIASYTLNIPPDQNPSPQVEAALARQGYSLTRS